MKTILISLIVCSLSLSAQAEERGFWSEAFPNSSTYEQADNNMDLGLIEAASAGGTIWLKRRYLSNTGRLVDLVNAALKEKADAATIEQRNAWAALVREEQEAQERLRQVNFQIWKFENQYRSNIIKNAPTVEEFNNFQVESARLRSRIDHLNRTSIPIAEETLHRAYRAELARLERSVVPFAENLTVSEVRRRHVLARVASGLTAYQFVDGFSRVLVAARGRDPGYSPSVNISYRMVKNGAQRAFGGPRRAIEGTDQAKRGN